MRIRGALDSVLTVLLATAGLSGRAHAYTPGPRPGSAEPLKIADDVCSLTILSSVAGTVFWPANSHERAPDGPSGPTRKELCRLLF